MRIFRVGGLEHPQFVDQCAGTPPQKKRHKIIEWWCQPPESTNSWAVDVSKVDYRYGKTPEINLPGYIPSEVDISWLEGIETLAGDWKGSLQRKSQLSSHACMLNSTK